MKRPRVWPWLILAASIAVGLFVAEPFFAYGYFIRVPRERDARLVGKWRGLTGFFEYTLSRTLILRPDGTWHNIEDMRGYGPKGTWGTEDGVLYVKWMATDAYASNQMRYRFLKDGRMLQLEPVKKGSWLFPPLLKRL